MNDWLTYKGSGSSRAVIAHAGTIDRFKQGSGSTVNGYERFMSRIQQVENKAASIVDQIQKAANQINTGVTALKTAQANVKSAATKMTSLESEARSIEDAIESSNMSDIQKSALRARMNKASNSINSRFDNLSVSYDTVGVVEDSLANALSNFKAVR